MADAQASGACSRKAVWVQVPSPASEKGCAASLFCIPNRSVISIHPYRRQISSSDISGSSTHGSPYALPPSEDGS